MIFYPFPAQRDSQCSIPRTYLNPLYFIPSVFGVASTVSLCSLLYMLHQTYDSCSHYFYSLQIYSQIQVRCL